MTRIPELILALTLTLIGVPSVFGETAADGSRHVRTTDSRLQHLMRDGLRASATFRELLERLQRSDVVVYLECRGPLGSGGRLTFVSAVGGYRYVHVRVAYMPAAQQQIAIIGHELRHAIEIAEAPSVVDVTSLAHEYERIGFVTLRQVGRAGIAFDTDAAVEAGGRVLRELLRATGPLPAALVAIEGAAY